MNVGIVGVQWGDEGKGKIVDLYGTHVDIIVRYQGGNNAGHTLVVNGKQTILHLIPSGVLHKGKMCLIANGVVFDPYIFFEEIDSLKEAGALGDDAHQFIKVSERTHLILPYHRLFDRLREERAAKGKIGTTVRGIGPTYEDKVARRGIQVVDLLHPKLLKRKLEAALDEKNALLVYHYQQKPIEVGPLYEECLKLGERLKPYIDDVRSILTHAISKKKPILFEGAQGTLLDVDHGTYPYVTSSNTVAGAVLPGCGLGPGIFDHVIGVAKAYTTRVGTGPFPTELAGTEANVGERLQRVGKEFGATTGRLRRAGWLDLVALKYVAQINGLTGLVLTKADVLDGFEQIKVCVAYELDGKTIHDVPACVDELERVKPHYEELEGWASAANIKGSKDIYSKADLPQGLRNYIQRIEDYVEVPVVMVSVGPGRDEALQLFNPFQ